MASRKRTAVATSSLPSESKSTCAETSSSDESSSCGFYSLPDELLLEIFTFLPQDELPSTVSLVCRLWNTVSSDPRLYRTLVISGKRPSTGNAVKLIEKASRLSRIELNERYDTNKLLECLAQRLANNRLQNTGKLKALVMTSCLGAELIRHISSTHLRSVMEHCTELSHLKLRFIHFSDSTDFQEIGTLLPSLTSLDVFAVDEYYTVEALQSITKRPHTLPFTSLFTDLYELNNTGSLYVSAFCKRFQETLTTFGVQNYSITAVDFTALLTCRKLTTLTLFGASCINDDRLLALGGMTNIRTLTLGSVDKVTPAGWISYFNLPHVRKIRRLDLQGCKQVDDNVALVIAQSLRDLEYLQLLGCWALTRDGHLRVQQVLNGKATYVPHFSDALDESVPW